MSRVIMAIIAKDLDSAKSDLNHFINEPKIGKSWHGDNQFGFYDYDYDDWTECNIDEMTNSDSTLKSWGAIYQGIPYFCEIWPSSTDDIQYAKDGSAIWQKNADWVNTCKQILHAITKADKLFTVTIHL